MIEDIIKANTAALEANTEAVKENSLLLRRAIELSPFNKDTGEVPAPVKPRGGKKAATPEQVVETPNVFASNETPDAAKTHGDDRTELVVEKTAAPEPAAETEDRLINDAEAQLLRATVRAGAARAADAGVHTAAFGELRKEFGVERITQLKLSQHAEFLARLEAL